MRSFVRSAVGMVGLLMVACGNDAADSPVTMPPSVATSSATADLPTTDVPTTHLPTTGPSVTPVTDEPATRPVTLPVGNGFAQPVVINGEGEMLVAALSGTGWIQPSPSSMVVVIDTRTGESREMPTGGANVSASGLNDAGLVAGYYTRGVTPCTAAPDPMLPDFDCTVPIAEAFVWDSVGGSITTLPGWAAIAGPNAAGLVVVAQDPDGPFSAELEQVAVWDSTTGGLTLLASGPALVSQQLGGRVARINDLGQVLGARGDSSIVIWDARTGNGDPLGPYRAGGGVPVSLGIDNDGRVLVVDSQSFGSYVWDPLGRQWHQLVGTLDIDSGAGGTNGSVATAMSSGGLVVGLTWERAAGSTRPRYGIQVWDLDTGQPPKSIGLGGFDYAMPTVIADTGQIIAGADVNDRSWVPYLYDPTTDTWSALGS